MTCFGVNKLAVKIVTMRSKKSLIIAAQIRTGHLCNITSEHYSCTKSANGLRFEKWIGEKEGKKKVYCYYVAQTLHNM